MMYLCIGLIAIDSIYAKDLMSKIVFCKNHSIQYMAHIIFRDLKQALRLCGWELVGVYGNRYFYRHPAVRDGLILSGKGNDEVPLAILAIVEQRLGQCLRPVLD